MSKLVDNLTVRTVRLKLLTGPFSQGHLLYLLTNKNYFSKGSYFNVKPGKLKVRNAMREITEHVH